MTPLNDRRFSWRGLFLAGLIGVLLLAAGVLLLLAFLLGDEDNPLTAPAAESKVVTLRLDGRTYTVTTEADTVAGLLEEQAIVLENGDQVTLPLDAEVHDTMQLAVERAETIAITIDSHTSVIRSTETNPLNLLSTLGMTLGAADRVFVDGVEVASTQLDTWNTPFSNLMVRRGLQVMINDEGETITHDTLGPTVGDALFGAEVDLFVGDVVTPPVDTPLMPNMEINITRSQPLTIIADGERIETRTGAATVGEALVDAGVVLYGQDYTFPGGDTPVVANTSVRVIRVTEEIITQEETLPFETVYQADASAPLDTRAVTQTGQEGVLQRTTRIRYENGVEVDRLVESEEVLTEKRDRIISYGTQIVLRTVDTPEGPREYWRKLRVYATSYHPAALGGSDITAIGMKLQHGVIGIDPNIIAYRTQMYVPGYGVGIAADTGLPRANPYWIDLGYSDDDWFNWHEWVDVYLLTPVPNEIDYFLPVTSQGGPVP